MDLGRLAQLLLSGFPPARQPSARRPGCPPSGRPARASSGARPPAAQKADAGADSGADWRADRMLADAATQPKMPPCAAIMRNPTSWNSGKYEAQQSAMAM